MTAWTLDHIGDQTGRTFVVTGPTIGGIGHHTALELARRGARVVLAGRDPERLDAAATAIRSHVPGADLPTVLLDLTDLSAVRRAAESLLELGRLEVLVNNAGVMWTPHRRTVDGLELQLATNHFGPFLLTGLLLPRLAEAGAGRVVTVSSVAHRQARQAPLSDPRDGSRRYVSATAYAESKLANLLFTAELDRRCRTAGVAVRALAAHPGIAGTHLLANGRLRTTGRSRSILDAAMGVVSQSPAAGALPVLMAATADLPGGSYCGPCGRLEWRGDPTLVGRSALAADPGAAEALWRLSERTVGLTYP